MKNEGEENGLFSIDSIYSDIQKLIIEKRVIVVVKSFCNRKVYFKYF